MTHESTIALLRATIEATADGILVLEPTGRVLLANEQFRTMWALPADVCAAEADLDCLLDAVAEQLDDPTLLREPIDILRAEPEASSFDVLTFRDGRTFERYSRPQVVDGQTVGRVWTFRNVSRRRRAEREALDSQRRFAHISKATNDGVYEWDITSDTLWCNDNFSQLFGYRPTEGVSPREWFFDRVHPADREKLEATLAAATSGETETWQHEFRFRTPANGYVVVFDRGYVERDESGSPLRLIGAMMDITSRKHTEQRLEQLTDIHQQLLQSQKMEAIGQLAGGIAHDFNNLLTVIKAHCEFLTEDIGPGHPLRSDVEAVAAAGDRASSLTRQLLAFSRQQFLKPVALDLNQVIKGVEPMLRRLISEDVVFTTVCRDDIGVVQADPRQIEQVLVNLAVNARDAMPQGGSLTVATGMAHMSEGDPKVVSGQLTPGDYTVLTVTDTGTGMPAQVRERIFDPFFTTKEQGKGTGLGLSTVYGIVKQSGGHVVVYSEPGQGSTFKVFLPRTAGTPEQVVIAQRPVPTRGSGTVLLVEDEDSLRDAARRSLERCGYTVVTARDGRDALRVANETGHLDLLLTDVVMPHLGGPMLADLMRIERPGLAVLFMSGYTDDDILRRGVLTHDAAFLEKPFTPHALATAARAALEGARKP